MSVPQLSVLMGLYNAAPYVEEAVRSVLDQSFKDLELLVCNDGSQDDGATIVERLAIGDDRITLVHNDKNRGYPYTINRLMDMARGKLLAFMDADDISLPGRFARQTEILLAEDGPDVVVQVGNPNDAFWSNNTGDPEDYKLKSHMTFYGNAIRNPSAMFKAEIVYPIPPPSKKCVTTQTFHMPATTTFGCGSSRGQGFGVCLSR